MDPVLGLGTLMMVIVSSVSQNLRRYRLWSNSWSLLRRLNRSALWTKSYTWSKKPPISSCRNRRLNHKNPHTLRLYLQDPTRVTTHQMRSPVISSSNKWAISCKMLTDRCTFRSTLTTTSLRTQSISKSKPVKSLCIRMPLQSKKLFATSRIYKQRPNANAETVSTKFAKRCNHCIPSGSST